MRLKIAVSVVRSRPWAPSLQGQQARSPSLVSRVIGEIDIFYRPGTRRANLNDGFLIHMGIMNHFGRKRLKSTWADTQLLAGSRLDTVPNLQAAGQNCDDHWLWVSVWRSAPTFWQGQSDDKDAFPRGMSVQ